MQINKNTVSVSAAAAVIKDEITLTDSFRLTEAMSNIKNLLFTKQSAAITSSQISDGILTAKGSAIVTLVYEGENGKPASLSGEIPFEYITQCEQEGIFVMASAAVESVKPSFTKQRRADVSVKLIIEGAVIARRELRPVHEVEEIPALCVKTENFGASLIKKLEERAAYDFELEINERNAEIIYSALDICEQTTSSSHAGVMFSAMVKADIVYSCEDDDGGYIYRAVSDAFSVNKLIETDITYDYDSYILSADICSQYAGCALEAETPSIEAGCEIHFALTFIKQISFSAITDLYSCEKLAQITEAETKLSQIKEYFSETLNLTDSARLSSGMNLPCAVSSSLSYEAVLADETLTVNGEVVAEALVLKSNLGDFELASITLPFVYKKENCPYAEEELILHAHVNTGVCEVSSDKLKVNVSVILQALGASESDFKEITEITVSDLPEYTENYTTVKVKYYEPGENLWDICKQNRISVSKLLSDNAVSSEDELKTRQALVIM